MKATNFYRGPYASSELIIMDESVYHLGIQNDEVAQNVILVGDPDRVEIISDFCDQQFSFRRSREFAISMNRIGNHDLTILSTGIGVDNIDIVLNELDAAVNIDFKTRMQKSTHTALNIVRIGTSGAIHPSVEIGDFVASAYAIGMDAVPYHYECELTNDE
ncbi:MAG: phosphorylase, partial [Bacteroidota bacterium]